MMKRIFMLMALALMVVAAMALTGVAQAASPKKERAKCQQEAASLTGGDLTGYNFVYGTNKNDGFTDVQYQSNVFCGLGGDDTITSLDLEAGDIFIGGAGNDSVNNNFGTFNGGDGIDTVVAGNPP